MSSLQVCLSEVGESFVGIKRQVEKLRNILLIMQGTSHKSTPSREPPLQRPIHTCNKGTAWIVQRVMDIGNQSCNDGLFSRKNGPLKYL